MPHLHDVLVAHNNESEQFKDSSRQTKLRRDTYIFIDMWPFVHLFLGGRITIHNVCNIQYNTICISICFVLFVGGIIFVPIRHSPNKLARFYIYIYIAQT